MNHFKAIGYFIIGAVLLSGGEIARSDALKSLSLLPIVIGGYFALQVAVKALKERGELFPNGVQFDPLEAPSAEIHDQGERQE